MKKYHGWDGTKKEAEYIINAILNDGSPNSYEAFPELTKKEVRSLLYATLTSDSVLVTIRKWMIFYFNFKEYVGAHEERTEK